MMIHPNMPASEYHSHPAVSNSVLGKIAISPAHARAYLDGEISEPTPAMKFGTAYHTAILEPEKFGNTYVVFDGDRRTKQGKEDYQMLIDSGATIISREDADTIREMARVMRANPDAAALLTGGIAEASVFWVDPATGLECKCRPDYYRESDLTIVDLKTAEDASPAGFARSVANYGYHRQDAHYSDGAQAERFVFIAQEKRPPYAVAVYELDETAKKTGLALRNRDLQVYASCAEFNLWPGYPEGIQTLSLPKWATQETE